MKLGSTPAFPWIRFSQQETGKHTQLASLELAIENGETAGACDTGFACPYTNTISWKSAGTPLPTQNSPRVLFERLFGDSGSTDPRARLLRLQQQKSVLDSVTEEVARLRGALPQSDRAKLTEYLEAVRGIERRIQIAEQQSDRELPVVNHPAGIPAGWEDHLKLMCDLQVLAYQCDFDPCHHLYGGSRTQRHDLSADRSIRRPSSHFAPCAGTGKDHEGS